MSGRQLPIIVALGTTQTLAWASSYYLPAILADPIGRDLGVSSNWIFGAFSASLVISALLGPRVGRQIDLVGGRSVLSASNLTLAAVIGFARAEEGGTKMRITPLTPWGSPIGDGFSIPCAGSRCRGPWRLNVSGVPYRFEVMALFAPGRAIIALEPVPNESGRVIFLSQNARDPIVLPTDRRGAASKTVALTEVSEAETRSVIKHPVLRVGTFGRIRIDVVGPQSE